MKNAFDIPGESIMRRATQAKPTMDTSFKPSGIHIAKDTDPTATEARICIKRSQQERMERAYKEFMR